MHFEKVVFAFFILLALSLNFGFFIGELSNPAHHGAFQLFAAVTVGLIATLIKLGDKSPVGAVLLASGLVANVQLIAACIVWAVAVYGLQAGLTASTLAGVVSLSGGALLANIVSVVILIVETALGRR